MLLRQRGNWNREKQKETGRDGRISENELNTFVTENHIKGKIKDIKQYQEKKLKERSNGIRKKEKKRKAVKCRV